MKPSSEKTAADPINRETALGLLTANLAVPGVGTFLAGNKVIGSIQTVIGIAGMGLTVIYGLKMVVWMLSNWAALHDPYADPVESLQSIWAASRLPLLGIALFAFSWLWAVLDSFRLLRRFPKTKSKPPLL